MVHCLCIINGDHLDYAGKYINHADKNLLNAVFVSRSKFWETLQ